MADKNFDVDEANALIPHLAPTLVELREKFEEAGRIRELIARAASRNGGSPHRERWSKTLARVTELLLRIQEWKVELRDVATGLIDFPAVVEDEEAYLCWRLGEPEVAYWHPRDAGFAGRRPL